MGKATVKIKAVVYGLSPYQQKVMPGLWKELVNKMTHKVTENWLNTILLVGPVVGSYTNDNRYEFCHGHENQLKLNPLAGLKYVTTYQEREKMEHRY